MPAPTLRKTAPVLLLVALSVGVASAAPTAAPAKPHTLKKIPKAKPTGHACLASERPTEKECLKDGYLDTPCGIKFRETCRPSVEDHLKATFEGSKQPEVRLLKPNKSELPRDIHKRGKVFEYTGPQSKRRMVGTFPRVQTIKGTTATKPRTASMTAAKVRDSVSAAPTSSAKLGSARPRYDLGKTKSKGGLKWMTSDNIFARTGLTRPPGSGIGSNLPTNAHRNPGWESNGDKVGSCEEFGYEMVYDWARYTDAVAACAGDLNCQLDIAFLPSTPGIAARTLRRKDGRPLASQIGYAKHGVLPKNDFFALGAKFAYAGGPRGVPKSAAIDELVTALKAGEKYYEIGCERSCGAHEFANEWKFHEQLHDANRTVSQAEFEEYERRKAKFRELASQWKRAVNREKEEMLSHLPKGEVGWINPIDLVSSDPLDRMGQMQQVLRQARSSGRAMSKKYKSQLAAMPGAGLVSRPAGAKAVPMGGGRAGVRGRAGSRAAPKASPKASPKAMPKAKPSASPSASPKSKSKLPGKAMGPVGMAETMPAGVLAAVKPGGPKPGTTPTGSGPGTSPAQLVSCNPADFHQVFETFGMGPISCQIGNFLRSEWRRKQKGYKSCLDLDDDDCDWSPMMFEAAFTKGVPYIDEQNQLETDCVDYTGDNFSAPIASLTETEAYIADMRGAIGEALNVLRPYELAAAPDGKKYGKAWTDADHFGDKDWFAAGYDYDMGWDVHPVKSPGSDVCQLGGGAHGGFGVDGWFIGNEFEIVDGLASGEYNRAGDKHGSIHVHLRVLGLDVLQDEHGKPTEINETFTGSWGEPLLQNSLDIPDGVKPSFTFMAGPVPITGAVWGEFFYGARFDVDLVTETNPDCVIKDVKLGAEATFTPELGLNAKAQIGVGISGLLSAGIRGMVNLVTVGVPVTVALTTTIKDIHKQAQTMLGFDLDVQLALSTLSGWIAVYVEVLFFEEEFVIFRWNGLGPETISLLGEPLKVELPVFSMK